MPLYEFRCPVGHDFEKFYRSIGAAPSTEKCPECGSMAERVMGVGMVVIASAGDAEAIVGSARVAGVIGWVMGEVKSGSGEVTIA